MSSKFLPTRPKRKFEHQICTFCEGTQEYEYFNHLKDLINNHPNNIIKFKLVPKTCGGGDPRTPVLSAIKNCNQNKIPVVVFDHDNKKQQFEEAIDLASKNKFYIGYSNINFDYWLTLHKLTESEIVYGEKANNDSYVELLKKTYNLKKTDDIKNTSIIKKIVNQITYDDVCKAIHNCQCIEKRNENTPGKRKSTKNGNEYYSNPDISVYKIVKKIIDKCIKKKAD